MKPRIPPPARSLGAPVTPRRYRTRGSRSVGTPATSDVSASSSSLAKTKTELKASEESFALTPLTRTSVLTDNTDIEGPQRKSWRKKLDDTSLNMAEILHTYNNNNANDVVEELINIEAPSLRSKNILLDLPDSSGNETVDSIVLPQCKLFTQIDNVARKKFDAVVSPRKSMAKPPKSLTADKIDDLHLKKLTMQRPPQRSRPAFPADLLSTTPDKTAYNELTMKVAPKKLLGQQSMKNKKREVVEHKNKEENVKESVKGKGNLELKEIQEILQNNEEDAHISRKYIEEVDQNQEHIALEQSQEIIENNEEDLQVSPEEEDQGGIEQIQEENERQDEVESEVEQTEEDEQNESIEQIQEDHDEVETDVEQTEEEIEQDVVEDEIEVEDSEAEQSQAEESNDLTEEPDYDQNESEVEPEEEEEIEQDDEEKENDYEMERDEESESSNHADMPSEQTPISDQTDEIQESVNETHDTTGRNRKKTRNDEVKSPEAMRRGTNSQNTSFKHQSRNTSASKTKSLVRPSVNQPSMFVSGRESIGTNGSNSTDQGSSWGSHRTTRKTLRQTFGKDFTPIKSLRALVMERSAQRRILANAELNVTKEPQANSTEINVNEQVSMPSAMDNKEDLAGDTSSDDDFSIRTKQLTLEITTGRNRKKTRNDEVPEAMRRGTTSQNTSYKHQSRNTSASKTKSLVRPSVNQPSMFVSGRESIGTNGSNSTDQGSSWGSHRTTRKTLRQTFGKDFTPIKSLRALVMERSAQRRILANAELNVTKEPQANSTEINVNEQVSMPSAMDNKEDLAGDTSSDDDFLIRTKQLTLEITTGRNRKKTRNDEVPEAMRRGTTSQNTSYKHQSRNTSASKTKSLVRPSVNQPSMFVSGRESIGTNGSNSTDQGSSWGSHRTTRKTLRQTFGKDFTPIKSLRALVMERSAQRRILANAELNVTKEPQANSTEINVNEQVSMPSAMDNKEDLAGDTSSDDDFSIRTKQLTLEITTGRNRKKTRNDEVPEAMRRGTTSQNTSYKHQSRNTSASKTKSLVRPSVNQPSMFVSGRESIGTNGSNSTDQGSSWGSHRTTRKTLRQTFGKDFTPIKSLRALVMERSAQRRILANAELNVTKEPQANSTEINVNEQVSMPSAMDNKEDLAGDTSSDDDFSIRTKQLPLETCLQKLKKDTLERKKRMRYPSLHRSRPAFPADLLSTTPDKTACNNELTMKVAPKKLLGQQSMKNKKREVVEHKNTVHDEVETDVEQTEEEIEQDDVEDEIEVEDSEAEQSQAEESNDLTEEPDYDQNESEVEPEEEEEIEQDDEEKENDYEMEQDEESESSNHADMPSEQTPISDQTDEIQESVNETHDTTGRNRKKTRNDEVPEAMRRGTTSQNTSYKHQSRNTSASKTKSLVRPSVNQPSMFVSGRESIGTNGSKSTDQGSSWGSHRTTRKTLRQTFGKDFTPIKSLRALVMERSAQRRILANAELNVTKEPQANSTEINVNEQVSMPSAMDNKEDLAGDTSSDDDFLIRTKQLPLEITTGRNRKKTRNDEVPEAMRRGTTSQNTSYKHQSRNTSASKTKSLVRPSVNQPSMFVSGRESIGTNGSNSTDQGSSWGSHRTTRKTLRQTFGKDFTPIKSLRALVMERSAQRRILANAELNVTKEPQANSTEINVNEQVSMPSAMDNKEDLAGDTSSDDDFSIRTKQLPLEITTGRNRKKTRNDEVPEAMRRGTTSQNTSYKHQSRNTSASKTKSLVRPSVNQPSMFVSGRESIGTNGSNSTDQGSSWGSHRTTRKTLRQTFGKDFTPIKSLRALVMERSAQRRILANAELNVTKEPQANSTEINVNEQVSMPSAMDNKEDLASYTSSDDDVSIRTKQLPLETCLQKLKKDTLERKKRMRYPSLHRSRPAFPADLLSTTPDKTACNNELTMKVAPKKLLGQQSMKNKKREVVEHKNTVHDEVETDVEQTEEEIEQDDVEDEIEVEDSEAEQSQAEESNDLTEEPDYDQNESEVEPEEEEEIEQDDEEKENDYEMEQDEESESSNHADMPSEQTPISDQTDEIQESVNETHDTTGRNRKKTRNDEVPEAMRRGTTSQNTSYKHQSRNTSASKTKSLVRPSVNQPSMFVSGRESIGTNGSKSTDQGSSWGSHRTTRKTLRQTFGKDFTPIKSLRALVMERSAQRRILANAELNVTKEPQANSTEINVNEQVSMPSAMDNKEDLAGDTSSDDDFLIRTKQLPLEITTGRNRMKTRNDEVPEAMRRGTTSQNTSYKHQSRNTSASKTKSLVRPSVNQPSMFVSGRESIGTNGSNSTDQGSSWGSHRTTRKTLRQTFGKDFTPIKSLRALVMERSAQRRILANAELNVTKEPQANSTEINVNEQVSMPSAMDNKEDLAGDTSSDDDFSIRTKQLPLEITTGRNRKKTRNDEVPEAMRRGTTSQNTSYKHQSRNTSASKTKSLVRPSVNQPSMFVSGRESIGTNGSNSTDQGSSWGSHRTTRKTLRQTFGKDFTPIKSLRALVMERSAQRRILANAELNVTKEPQANSTEINVNEQVSMPSAMDNKEDLASYTSSDDDVSIRTKQLPLETCLQKLKKDTLERKKRMEAAVRDALKAPPRNFIDDFNFKLPANFASRAHKVSKPPTQPKRTKRSAIQLGAFQKEFLEDLKYRPPKRYVPKNASWATKNLYEFLESKLNPKYDYWARVRAEKLVETLHSFGKLIQRAEVAPQGAIDELKVELARLQVVQTHFDFYNFFQKFMPREMMIKVIPDVVNKLPMPESGLYSDIIRHTNQ